VCQYRPGLILAYKPSMCCHGHVLGSDPNASYGQGTGTCDEPEKSTNKNTNDNDTQKQKC